MGYKTKSMLKAIGRNYEPKQQITQGTRPQAGAYSRGNKDWNAVKSAINMPDNFEDAATALGTKIGEEKSIKEKEAKKLAERQRLEKAAEEARNSVGGSFTVDEKKIETLKPTINTSMTTPGRSLNPVTQSFNNAGVDLTPNFKASNKKFDPKSGLIINSNIMGGPLMTAPDAFEKSIRRKAKYKK